VDHVAKALASYTWPYADQDARALGEIGIRVELTARAEGLITYTELVSGIDFHLATVNKGEPFRLGVPDWSELHRAIVGDFLGRLCVDSYLAGKFMASALVVATDTRQPSEGYRALMRDLGLLRGKGELEFLTHWIAETRKAYAWYAKHR
jgi:hypothetical protein